MMTTIQNISFLLAFLIISCADWGEYLSREDSTGFSTVILLLLVWLPLNIFSLCCGIKIIYISIKEKMITPDSLFAAWLTFGSIGYYNFFFNDIPNYLISATSWIIILFKTFILFTTWWARTFFKSRHYFIDFFNIVLIVIVALFKIRLDNYFYITIMLNVVTLCVNKLKWHRYK